MDRLIQTQLLYQGVMLKITRPFVCMYLARFHVKEPDSLMTSDLPTGAIAPCETGRLIYNSIGQYK